MWDDWEQDFARIFCTLGDQLFIETARTSSSEHERTKFTKWHGMTLVTSQQISTIRMNSILSVQQWRGWDQHWMCKSACTAKWMTNSFLFSAYCSYAALAHRCPLCILDLVAWMLKQNRQTRLDLISHNSYKCSQKVPWRFFGKFSR